MLHQARECARTVGRARVEENDITGAVEVGVGVGVALSVGVVVGREHLPVVAVALAEDQLGALPVTVRIGQRADQEVQVGRNVRQAVEAEELRSEKEEPIVDIARGAAVLRR